MKFYSEDKKVVSSSILLSKFLNIDYVSGNEELKKLEVSDENIVAYIDMVPDNEDSVELYNFMWNEYTCDIYKGVIPISIPCTEYYIILALVSMNYDFKFRYRWLEVVLYCILNRVTIKYKLPPKLLGYAESFYSFEKQCKLLIANSSDELENYNTVDSVDCIEKNKISWYLTDSCGISMYDKCCKIASKMPVVMFRDKCPDNFSNVNIHDVAGICNIRVNKWTEAFKKIKLPNKW